MVYATDGATGQLQRAALSEILPAKPNFRNLPFHQQMIYILGDTFEGESFMSVAHKDPTGKVFMHGRSQAVRLPKEFRISGKEVRISRLGHKLVLEPIENPKFDVATWRAKLRAQGASDFLPEGRPDQPPMPSDEPSFD